MDGHIIRTDGTTTLGGDDKGAVASILEIVEDIVETNRPHKEFYIMFTVSEETSMQGPNTWTRPACHARTWS